MKIEMNGYEYEKYCASWLKKHGYHNIQVTKASNDQGIDILAYKKRKRYGFQCKYYESPVGNDAVQQAFTGAAYYNCDIAAVITNTTFTRSAISLAQETDVLLLDSVIPNKQSFLNRLLNIYAWFLLCISIGLLVYECTFLQYQDSTILASSFLCISTVLYIINYHSSFHLCISLISSFISFILSFQYTYLSFSHYFTILILLFHVFTDIRFIHLCINHKKEYHSQVQLQMNEQFHQSIDEKGIKFAERLTDETHHTITYLNHEIKEQQIQYRFRSTTDISNDFPLLQYSFNQYASYTNTTEEYTFDKLTPKTFQITVKDSHTKNK